MANEVTKRGAPAPMLPGLADDQHVAALIGSFQIEDDGDQVLLDRFPTKDERVLLQERNRRLQSSLRRCDLATADLVTARSRIGLFFSGYTSLRQADAPGLVNSYLFVLQVYPLFAILGACDDASHNRLKNHDEAYPPNAAQMARAAADHVARAAGEQLKIDKLLRAKKLMQPETDEAARARVKASLADFHARFNTAPVAGLLTPDEADRQKARRSLTNRDLVLREWKNAGIDPIYNGGDPMSMGLAVKLGRVVERRTPEGGRYYERADYADPSWGVGSGKGVGGYDG